MGTLSLGIDKKPTPKIMKKCNLIIIFALALLPNHTALADCIDCWVNPKTGKLEPFGLDAQQEAARAQSPTAFVYGTNTCPLTVGLLQELKQQKKNVTFYQNHFFKKQLFIGQKWLN